MKIVILQKINKYKTLYLQNEAQNFECNQPKERNFPNVDVHAPNPWFVKPQSTKTNVLKRKTHI